MSFYPFRLLRLLVSASLLIALAFGKGGGGHSGGHSSGSHSSSSHSSAPVSVKGYTRKDGTYVEPHMRSAPNGTTSDNYSTKGNVNPYTGKPGTKPDTKPASGAAPAAAGTSSEPTSGASADATKKTPISLSSVVKVGMNKAQVLIAAGSPNVKTDTSWFYVDRGWVRFKEGAVTTIEAPSQIAGSVTRK